MLDVRIPIGYLFVIIGGILLVYGLVDPQLTSLEIVGKNPAHMILNLNLPCGAAMVVFAAMMLVLVRLDVYRSKKKGKKTAPENSEKELAQVGK